MNPTVKKRRLAMLQYISAYWEKNHIAPTVRELQGALDIRSTSTVSTDLHALMDAGKIIMTEGSYRSIRPIADVEEVEDTTDSPYRSDVFDIPLYGAVAAGSPIYAEDVTEESVPLPSSFFPNDGADYFVLEIRGESMIEAGIYDGDHVIVRRQDTARNGQQVVALLDDSATVKTFFRRPDHIELRPENAAMDPIIVKDCRILGIVCGLYRLY